MNDPKFQSLVSNVLLKYNKKDNVTIIGFFDDCYHLQFFKKKFNLVGDFVLQIKIDCSYFIRYFDGINRLKFELMPGYNHDIYILIDSVIEYQKNMKNEFVTIRKNYIFRLNKSK